MRRRTETEKERHRQEARRYYAKYRDKIRLRVKAQFDADPEKFRQWSRESYQRRKETINAKRRGKPLTETQKEYHRKYRAAHQRRLVLRRYGLTESEYEARLEAQGRRCAVCFDPIGERIFSVDHDHDTDEVRGLLCHGCNFLLGVARDDISILYNAIAYLRGDQKVAA